MCIRDRLYSDGGEAATAPGAGTTEIVTGSGEKIEIGNLPEGSIDVYKRQVVRPPEYTHKWGLHIRPQSRIFGAKTKERQCVYPNLKPASRRCV